MESQDKPVSPHEESQTVMEEPQALTTRLLFGAVGGLIAAVIGGAIWGLIVDLTGYEIGYIAWGIGLLSGFAVLTASLGSKGPLFQVVAVASSILGIFIGKYYSFYAIFKDLLEEDFGAEVAAELSLFDLDFFQIFLESLGEMASPYDLLWIGFAVYTSWRMLAK